MSILYCLSVSPDVVFFFSYKYKEVIKVNCLMSMVFSKAGNEVGFKISHMKVLCFFLKSPEIINHSIKEGMTAVTFHNPCQAAAIFVEQFVCKLCKCRVLKQKLVLRLLEEGYFHTNYKSKP